MKINIFFVKMPLRFFSMYSRKLAIANCHLERYGNMEGKSNSIIMVLFASNINRNWTIHFTNIKSVNKRAFGLFILGYNLGTNIFYQKINQKIKNTLVIMAP